MSSLALSKQSNIIYLSLGSNIGDRAKNLQRAIELLQGKCDILAVSTLYETEPMHYLDQDKFINIAIRATTKLEKLELLDFTQSVENELKRVKTMRYGPRIIDVDILFYNDEIYADDRLTIPHPMMWEREFVLKPLLDVTENDELKSKIEKKLCFLKESKLK